MSGSNMSLPNLPQTDISSAIAQIGFRPQDPSILNGNKWSEADDEKLWDQIVVQKSKSLPNRLLGRSRVACRVRYCQLLRQVMFYAYDACGTWSDEEDRLLVRRHSEKENYAQIATEQLRARTAMDCWIRLFELLKDQTKRASSTIAFESFAERIATRYGDTEPQDTPSLPYGPLSNTLTGSLSNLLASNQPLYFVDLEQRIAGSLLGIPNLHTGAAYTAGSIVELIPRGEPPFDAIFKEYNKKLPTREQLTASHDKGLVKATDRDRFGEVAYGFDEYLMLIYAYQELLMKHYRQEENPRDPKETKDFDTDAIVKDHHKAWNNEKLDEWWEAMQEANREASQED